MSMTKSQVEAAIAESTGLSKKQVKLFFEEQAKLACAEAANGFNVPGLGKLVLVDRAARMGRNPATGEQIQIPAKKAVKFRVAKVCKDALLNA